MMVSFTSAAVPEKIVSKQDADYIFSLTKSQWEAYAQKMVHPEGGEIKLSLHDTGTSVMAFDPKTGFGLSAQPLYDNETSPLEMLIVGSYFPLGSLPEFTDELKREIEAEAKKDLGVKYEVSANYTETPPLEGIELMITKVPIK
jgi:hypothetical protein